MFCTITYSPAHTLVPTYECFNRCSYCNFRVDLGTGTPLSISAAKSKLKNLSSTQVIEILVLSGEIHPLSPERGRWFERIYQICELALSMGFLPHTNAGILNWHEMKQLKQVNASMGLMLEQLNPKFLQTVHKQAPSKQPELRLQQLEWAGKLQIPFTTGLLLGIGETESDRLETLKAIAKIQTSWGHIQEVILQPYSLGTQQDLVFPSFTLDSLPSIVAQAREILPDSIAIQIPPNLISTPQILIDCLTAGATDLGGISPKDEVNPDYPHLSYDRLAEILHSAGWSIKPRLPIYPQYYSWLPQRLLKIVKDKERAFETSKT